MAITAEYDYKEHHCSDIPDEVARDTMVYWFRVSGVCEGGAAEFKETPIAIAESKHDRVILDADVLPVNEAEREWQEVDRACVVTDRMRAE